uniref:SET domain-containing protein n=1 Tax=Dendroctonus ponderosae TaxID=77166 RepID=A0AAR5Q5A7_DENPD
CINAGCAGASAQFLAAPDFCLSYFRVKKSSSHKAEICMACYWRAVEDNDKLATSLQAGQLLFEVDFPIINETLQIDDSDEEGQEGDAQKDSISEENLEFITRNIESVLLETMERLDMKSHLQRERAYLHSRAQSVGSECAQLSEGLKQVRSTLDRMQIELYNEFRPEIKAQKGLMILDDFSLSPTLQIRPENVPVLDVAAPGFPCADGIYYISKQNNFLGSWIKARLQQIIPARSAYKGQFYKRTHYRLVELKQQHERILEGKYVAYLGPCKSRLTVGSRVLSQFKETNAVAQGKRPRAVPYYAGVVGEHPVENNHFRYLIFFDIGYAQYVQHSDVNLIFEAPEHVWEDMPEDTRPFIRKYLESQDRPMVKLSSQQKVKVEYNGKWWLCTVKSVDCSLVQVYFDSIERCEWIYRGSTRLSPMFREELAATTRHIGLRTPRKLGANESATVVQYKRNDDYVQQPAAPDQAPRAVARKSTTRPNRVSQPAPKCVPFLPTAINAEPPNAAGPTSKIMYFTPRDQQVTKREYRAHQCSSACKAYITHNFVKLRGHNPLSKPLLCGWARMTLKDRGRKSIIYKAPCGRMVRDISEVHAYLQATQSEMTVDLFDFNHMVRCLAEFNVECVPDPKDLSSGLEQVPIPVINGFNNDMLDFCNYSTRRVPMEGVHMNLDEDFLCGCDCDDDCVVSTPPTANEDGKQYGDEYFAELDFIETVEKYKEDYEEEALEDEEGSEPERQRDEDEEEEEAKASSKKRNVYMHDNDFQPGQVLKQLPPQGIRARLRKRKEEPEPQSAALEQATEDMDTVTISDDDDDGREVLSFNPMAKEVDERNAKYLSVRELFGAEERDNIYIMDAKNAGNIGRFLNHSCSPNVFVQNVFVDTHDVRFPWVAFFSLQFIRAGTELTWNYNYDIGSVPGRILYCHCASLECKGRLL